MGEKDDLKKLSAEIQEAGSLSQIQELLDGLGAHIERLISGTAVGISSLQDLASYLAKIRGLLEELTTLAIRRHGSVKDEALVSLLRRFSDLEGRVKEMRNDLQVQGKAKE